MLLHHTALSKLHHHLSKRSRPELPWARLLHYLFRFRFLRPTVKRSCRRSSPKFLCFAGLRSFGFMPRSSAPADRPTAAMSLGPGSAASATPSHALDQFGEGGCGHFRATRLIAAHCASTRFGSSSSTSTATNELISAAACTFCGACVLECKICKAALIPHESIFSEARIMSALCVVLCKVQGASPVPAGANRVLDLT